MTARQTRGRPRAFDTDEVLQQSVNLFWRQGYSRTTTRTLENELGLSQSSLYNAFGSKEELFSRVVDRYEKQLDATVLSHLAGPDPDRASILSFLDELVDWVHGAEHRGCLVLNLAAESEENGSRVKAYRTKLRRLLRPALRSFTSNGDDVEARTELLVAVVLGLNISARSGASRAELRRLVNGIKHQVNAW